MRYGQLVTNTGTGSATDVVANGSTLAVHGTVKYTLYDGPDALIANKLLELGVTVNPNNVDWYKRTTVEQQEYCTASRELLLCNGGAQ